MPLGKDRYKFSDVSKEPCFLLVGPTLLPENGSSTLLRNVAEVFHSPAAVITADPAEMYTHESRFAGCRDSPWSLCNMHAFRSTTIQSATQKLSEIRDILLHMTNCRVQTEYLLLPRDTFYSAAVLRSHQLTAPQMFHIDDTNFLYTHTAKLSLHCSLWRQRL
jgi:hypothetical protein